jgi:hypothetical protein
VAALKAWRRWRRGGAEAWRRGGVRAGRRRGGGYYSAQWLPDLAEPGYSPSRGSLDAEAGGRVLRAGSHAGEHVPVFSACDTP